MLTLLPLTEGEGGLVGGGGGDKPGEHVEVVGGVGARCQRAEGVVASAPHGALIGGGLRGLLSKQHVQRMCVHIIRDGLSSMCTMNEHQNKGRAASRLRTHAGSGGGGDLQQSSDWLRLLRRRGPEGTK